MKKLFISLLIVLFIPALVFPFSKDGTTYTTDGTLSDANAAITDADVGDTVTIPSGNYTWGTSGTYLDVDKAITIQGAGKGVTNITLSSSGRTWGSGTISIIASATVKSMTINGVATTGVTAFSVYSANDWRITDIDFNGAAAEAYFVYVGDAYGLIDNNDVTGGSGSSELIFVRGSTSSWQTAHSMGGANNVFIEDNTFSGSGYVCDMNSNARGVIRYNTISGQMKIDGHGKASNTPARGVRHMEVYENTWTNAGNYWTALELRGGTGMVFNNNLDTSGDIWITLTEYGCTAAWPNFSNTCQCPTDYPIDDQIGVGIDPKAAASEPMYLWNNLHNGSAWSYAWLSTAACTGTCGSFSIPASIIVADQDYYDWDESFDGTSGVGRGALASRPATCTAGVGYWVTDEAEWNANSEGVDGCLYTCDVGDDAWSLYYTPDTYPHDLRGEGEQDTTPPIIQNIVPLPTVEYISTTTEVTVTWDTDECAVCRIGEIDAADEDDLTNEATVDVRGACGLGYGTSFSFEFTGLNPEDAITAYIGGQDESAQANETISNEVSAFTIAESPPPGDRMTVVWQ